MSARLSKWAVGSWMIVGIAVASCGREEAPPLPVGDRSGEVSISIELPPASEEAGVYAADFGAVPVGGIRSLPVSIMNRGRMEVVIDGPALGAPFGTDLPAAGLRIGGARDATVELRFEPTVEGEAVAELSLTARTADGSLEIRIRLAGVGVSPSLDCTPSVLDFGSVIVGEEKALSFRCENPLDAPISVQEYPADEHDELSLTFTRDAEGPLVVGARGVLEGQIVYRPKTAGHIAGVVELRDDGDSVLAWIMFQAVGQNCLDILPRAVAFPICGPSVGAFNLTVHSACEGVVIDSIEIGEGPSSDSFQIARPPSLPLTLDVDEVAKFGVSFTPAEDDPATVTGTVVVTSRGVDYRIPVTGYTATKEDEVFVIDWSTGSRLALTSTPTDRNGDGTLDEQDFDVYFGDTRIEPIDEADERSWWYDADSNSIVFTFVAAPMTGTTVTVKFVVGCPF